LEAFVLEGEQKLRRGTGEAARGIEPGVGSFRRGDACEGGGEGAQVAILTDAVLDADGHGFFKYARADGLGNVLEHLRERTGIRGGPLDFWQLGRGNFRRLDDFPLLRDEPGRFAGEAEVVEVKCRAVVGTDGTACERPEADQAPPLW
jgi:hypothetical protein